MIPLVFEAKLGGDGECFCFKVSKETYKTVLGEDRYLQEICYMRQAHAEIYDTMQFVEPTEWCIYPSQLIPYKDNTNYIVTYGIVEKEKLT